MNRYAAIAGALIAVVGTTLSSAVPQALAVGSAAGGMGMSSSHAVVADDAPDQIVLRDGRVIRGTITEETETTVRMTVVYAGISAPASYTKSDILKIVRGERDADGNAVTPAIEDDRSPIGIQEAEESTDGKKVIYYMELDGEFMRDINKTPVTQAVERAERYQPDILLVRLDNTWSQLGIEFEDDVAVSFDQYFVVEEIAPVFTKVIPREWEKQPEIIFWVRNAMGGAAFLPFLADQIYFHPEGRMGGVGTLSQLFGSTGDESVREKQYSLRLTAAQGLAIRKGYDPRIIEAMARSEYVLSYSLTGGLNLLERMPENPGEILLTDDGRGDNADEDEEIVRGLGNDVLTLKADTAQKLGISRGTYDNLDDLLFDLGVLDNHVMIEKDAENVLDNWSEQIDRVERQLPKMMQEYAEIVPRGDDVRDEIRAVGRRISQLKKILRVVERYGESLRGIPNVPSPQQLRVMIDQHELEQIQLRGQD